MTPEWEPCPQWPDTARVMASLRKGNTVRDACTALMRGGLFPQSFLPDYTRAFSDCTGGGDTELPASIADAIAFAQYGRPDLLAAEQSALAFARVREAIRKKASVCALIRWRVVEADLYLVERAARGGEDDDLPFAILVEDHSFRAVGTRLMAPAMRLPCLALWAAGFALDRCDEISVTLAVAR